VLLGVKGEAREQSPFIPSFLTDLGRSDLEVSSSDRP
jgi:hypothetical protein